MDTEYTYICKKNISIKNMNENNTNGIGHEGLGEKFITKKSLL